MNALEEPKDLTRLSLPELRLERQSLTKLEGQVSYWRRILQARIDLMRDGMIKRGATVEGLQRVLSQQLGQNNRLALMSVQPGHDTPIDGLGTLWNRGVSLGETQTAGLESDLVEAELRLSARRTELHQRIDAATAELVRRYRENPQLALSALPARSVRPSPL